MQNQPQAPGQKPWVQFRFNEAQRVSLKSLRYTVVADMNNRSQFLYWLADGRKMYVDPMVGGQIQSLEIQPNEPILVTKRRAPDGRNVSWEVKRPQAQPVAEFLDNTSVEEYGEELAARNPDLLQRALEETIAACSKAEKYAETMGYACRFTPGDIRAMAISKMIGMQQRGYAA